MKSRIKFVMLLLCSIALLVVSSCSQQDEQHKPKGKKVTTDKSMSSIKTGPIKIGAILPLTGPLGYLGEGEKNALELAINDINKKHNSPVVQLIIEDSKGHSSDAVTAANKLVSIDNVTSVITATTSVSRAVLPIVTGANRLMVALCMDPTIQNESLYAFRLYEGMDQEAETLLQFYAKNGKSKRVGMLYINHAGTVQQLNDYFLPGFKKIGIKMVYQEPYELKENSFRDKVGKLRNDKVDSLIIIGFGFKYFPIFKELSQQGLVGKIEISGGWGFIAPNKVPPSFLEGVVVASPQYVFSKNAAGETFQERYQDQYDKKPNFDDAFAYQAGIIISNAMLKANGKTQNASSDLTNSIHSGIMGDVMIDSSGAMHVPMGLGIIHNGQVQPFSE